MMKTPKISMQVPTRRIEWLTAASKLSMLMSIIAVRRG
jgi:hypothetical protein